MSGSEGPSVMATRMTRWPPYGVQRKRKVPAATRCWGPHIRNTLIWGQRILLSATICRTSCGQLGRDRVNAQVRVAHQHRRRCVPAHLHDLRQDQALLENPADALMPEVVKVQGLDR